VNKYPIQDYLDLANEKIKQLYKSRTDCEHAKFLLKGQLVLSDLKNAGKKSGKSQHLYSVYTPNRFSTLYGFSHILPLLI